MNTTKAEPNAGTEGCQGGKKEPPLVVAIAASAAAGSKGNILMTKDVVHCTQLITTALFPQIMSAVGFFYIELATSKQKNSILTAQKNKILLI